ncbi:MAG: hypothetical protein AVDCRST_MAG93-2392 [uncultured Chloroflexia bacterium]|uniref:Uncharacterized protein n=1 Tax=uncultured Chloroflexia bacterium TaxID=1672391 RepID=A0A6J4IYU1_9CHLR|nr:MAG: hypothetical protein AVDCRST_MAG93-2392 [uncultured Chloroflexia bacterium]
MGGRASSISGRCSSIRAWRSRAALSSPWICTPSAPGQDAVIQLRAEFCDLVQIRHLLSSLAKRRTATGGVSDRVKEHDATADAASWGSRFCRVAGKLGTPLVFEPSRSATVDSND